MDASSLARERPPTFATVRAAAELLLDPNPRVHRICEDQLLAWGEASRASLEALCECEDLAARERVRRVLRMLNVRLWITEFGAFAAGPEADLEQGLLLISRLPRPLIETSPVSDQLGSWAEQLRPQIEGVGQRKLVHLLARFFHADLGFRGDRRNYYDPDNSYLDQVVRRRRGIPISLCALYLLVGRRLSLPLEGVGLPGHFIVRLRGARSILVDPFHGGRIVTRRDCAERLQAMGYSFQNELLQPVSDRRMLIRCLGNLLHAFGFTEDGEFARAAQEARSALAAGA